MILCNAMKRILVISLAVLLSVCAASAHVDNVPTKFVYYSDGDVNAFPSDVLAAFEADSDAYKITLKGDSVIVIPRQEVETVLMSVLGVKYEKPDKNGIFLNPKDKQTHRICNENVGRMQNDAKWPPATSPDATECLQSPC